MEKSLKSSSLNYGIYLGIILSAFTIIGYVQLDLFTKIWFGLSIMVVVIVLGMISSVKEKKLLGGYISFKDAFTAFFIAILVGLVISTLVSFIIFGIVDPEAASIIQEKAMESQVAMLQNFGTPQETIDAAMAEARATKIYSIGNILKTLAFQLVGFSLVGLIVAAVVKKNDPHAA